jgi:hypothetical protein
VKFGDTFTEDTKSDSNTGGGGRWMKTLKEGDTKMRFLSEFGDEDGWVIFYEHYNPVGSSFPCTRDRSTCPGCTSDNERMKSASRKVAVNAVVGQYQDVYKLPITLVNRLRIRSDRNGSITDRDYIITRIGTDQSTQYDVESANALPIDLSAYELMDINKMLEESFNESWPDFQADQVLKAEAPTPEPKKKGGGVMSVIAERAAAAEQKPETSVPPSEPAAQSDQGEQEVELTLDQLHGMTPEQLRTLCLNNGAPVPDGLSTQQEIISWMEKQFA